MNENIDLMDGLTDADVHPPMPDYGTCTSLEVIINLLHPDGHRTSPQCNRIRVALQVGELTKREYLFFADRINNAIGSLFLRDELLRRLVRSQTQADAQAAAGSIIPHKYRGRIYMPLLDRIGIQEIRPSDQYADQTSPRAIRSTWHPDAYDRDRQDESRTECCNTEDQNGSTQ